MFRRVLIACLLVGSGWSQVTPAPAPVSLGTIAGTIRGDDGAAIEAGSITLAWLNPPPNSRAPQFVTQAISSSGAFQYAGLNPGIYRLCVQAADPMWLNPCEWGGVPASVTVSASQPVPAVSLILKKGAVVPVRVDDPTQVLAVNDGKTPGAQLMLSVGNDNLQQVRVPVVSADSLGRNLQVVVPYGRTINLIVSGSFFKITNVATGALLPSAPFAIPLLTALGQTPVGVHLTVTGVNP
jgi:hypothetical protein